MPGQCPYRAVFEPVSGSPGLQKSSDPGAWIDSRLTIPCRCLSGETAVTYDMLTIASYGLLVF